jgi:hypothetical protein
VAGSAVLALVFAPAAFVILIRLRRAPAALPDPVPAA